MEECGSDPIEENAASCRPKSAFRRRSTRSKVWEKVAWFTKKGKGAKENETFEDEHEQFPELGSRGDGGKQQANRSRSKDAVGEKCQGALNEKRRARKAAGSFRYLKKRKARQLGDEPAQLVSFPLSQSPDTATGTFHDFTSGRVRSRQGSSSSVLNEIARGMQRSRAKGKENAQSVLSLPLGDLSLNEPSLHGNAKHSESLKPRGSVPSAAASKCGPSVWRSCSFSAPSYNSWPRKKRTSLGSLLVGTLSPPQKQKCPSGLKKTATFSGFESSRINIKETCQALFKGMKSTPHLTKGSQIKNQDKVAVGVIDLRENLSKDNSCEHPNLIRSSKNLHVYQEKIHDSRIQGLSLQEQHITDHPERSVQTFGSFHSKKENKVSQQENKCLEEYAPDSAQDCPEFMCVEADHSLDLRLPSCEILGARLLDNDNEVYNVTTLHRVSGSDHGARGSWADNQDETEVEDGPDHITGQCPWVKLSPVTPSLEFAGDVTARDTTTMAAEELTCSSLMTEKTNLGVVPDFACASVGHPDMLPKPLIQQSPCLELNKQSVGCQTEPAGVFFASRPSATGLPNIICSKGLVDDSIPECRAVLGQFSTGISEGELVSRVDCGDSTSQEAVMSPAPDIDISPRPAISGSTFKQNMEVILQHFQEFNDEQKNIMIRRLLGHCGVPQMHVLSVAMEPILHKNCPPNCQDVLAWLPSNVAYKVLSYLDAVSLCRCDQVNKLWHNLASSPTLWKRLCRIPIWQLSRSSEEKQLQKYTSVDGTTHWKKVLAERFLLRQNWLSGNFEVRNFQGHTQGISCVQFDDSRIASGSSDKTIKVWDMKSEDSNAVLTLAGHSATVRCLNLNGNRLVSGSVDRSIKVWDLSFKSYWSGASCRVTMLGHMHTVRCLQVDDDKVVSGSYDKTLKVWDIKTGHCRLTLRGHTAAVLCVQFDDRKIVSGSYDKTIKVWSLGEGSCLMTLTGHHDAVTCLNLTFDGRRVISGSLDHNLKFWDLATGKSIGTLDWIRSEGHTGVVRCLQSDSWRIVSAGDDKTMKMWSLETGQRLLTLRCHTDGVTCLQFNDFRIVSGSYDQTVKLWNFAPSHEFLSPE